MNATALSMRAKYNSTCPACGRLIAKGDIIALYDRKAYCSASCLPEDVPIVNRQEREHPNDTRERHNAAFGEPTRPVAATDLESTEARIERMHNEKMAVLERIASALEAMKP